MQRINKCVYGNMVKNVETVRYSGKCIWLCLPERYCPKGFFGYKTKVMPCLGIIRVVKMFGGFMVEFNECLMLELVSCLG